MSVDSFESLIKNMRDMGEVQRGLELDTFATDWADRLEALVAELNPYLLPALRGTSAVAEVAAESHEEQEARSLRVAELMGVSPWSIARAPKCSHPDTWFSRTTCPEPCGAMHNYCTDCGRVADYCPHEMTESGENQ